MYHVITMINVEVHKVDITQIISLLMTTQDMCNAIGRKVTRQECQGIRDRQQGLVIKATQNEIILKFNAIGHAKRLQSKERNSLVRLVTNHTDQEGGDAMGYIVKEVHIDKLLRRDNLTDLSERSISLLSQIQQNGGSEDIDIDVIRWNKELEVMLKILISQEISTNFIGKEFAFKTLHGVEKERMKEGEQFLPDDTGYHISIQGYIEYAGKIVRVFAVPIIRSTMSTLVQILTIPREIGESRGIEEAQLKYPYFSKTLNNEVLALYNSKEVDKCELIKPSIFLCDAVSHQDRELFDRNVVIGRYNETANEYRLTKDQDLCPELRKSYHKNMIVVYTPNPKTLEIECQEQTSVRKTIVTVNKSIVIKAYWSCQVRCGNKTYFLIPTPWKKGLSAGSLVVVPVSEPGIKLLKEDERKGWEGKLFGFSVGFMGIILTSFISLIIGLVIKLYSRKRRMRRVTTEVVPAVSFSTDV
jgi:hypothetical protein